MCYYTNMEKITELKSDNNIKQMFDDDKFEKLKKLNEILTNWESYSAIVVKNVIKRNTNTD